MFILGLVGRSAPFRNVHLQRDAVESQLAEKKRDWWKRRSFTPEWDSAEQRVGKFDLEK
jgi:hypothetical protein